MRRVSTHINTYDNAVVMFDAGVEQIVSHHMSHPSTYDDQELRAMERSPKYQTLPISLFTVLAQQLIWKKAGHQY